MEIGQDYTVTRTIEITSNAEFKGWSQDGRPVFDMDQAVNIETHEHSLIAHQGRNAADLNALDLDDLTKEEINRLF